MTYLEPVDGAAVDERRELAETVTEGVADGTHGEHDVQLIPAALDEHVEECDRRPVRLLRFVTLSVATIKSNVSNFTGKLSGSGARGRGWWITEGSLSNPESTWII